MKKILCIVTLLIAGIGYSQAPQITQAQLENSKVLKEKTDKFNAIIDQKVDQIMKIANVDANKRGELLELVANKEGQTAKIERENISEVLKKSKINDVRDAFETKLKAFLGEKKYALVQNALNPR